MTQSIDTFLINHGFEAEDLCSVQHRPALYSAIIIAGLSASLFAVLAVQVWI